MYFDENNNYFDVLNNSEFEFDEYNTKINIENINFRGDNLYTLSEGFNKGNMFKNIYSKYKNHVYKLKVNNVRDELLYKIQMYCFAVKDLNLYLDVHPNDKEMLNKFNEYNMALSKLKSEYNKKYSPLLLNDMDNTNTFDWISNPWPWDKGGK